ncbi:MAG: DUF3467 domain-containing protein [Lentisphaeraceae bacterium]|nr:DUF3467 domain-containing protein [Lentisphaeraceae bacterium]
MSDQDKAVKEQAEQQTGNKKVRLRVNQSDMETTYANSFRPIASTEEVMLDFGVNQTFPVAEKKGDGPSAEIVFNVSSRVVMNFYTAKRLAVALGQVVNNYEKEFGELKLNAADRKISKETSKGKK